MTCIHSNLVLEHTEKILDEYGSTQIWVPSASARVLEQGGPWAVFWGNMVSAWRASL